MLDVFSLCYIPVGCLGAHIRIINRKSNQRERGRHFQAAVTNRKRFNWNKTPSAFQWLLNVTTTRPSGFMANNLNLTADSASFLTEGLLSLGPYKHHPLSLQIEYVSSVSIDLRPFKAESKWSHTISQWPLSQKQGELIWWSNFWIYFGDSWLMF